MFFSFLTVKVIYIIKIQRVLESIMKKMQIPHNPNKALITECSCHHQSYLDVLSVCGLHRSTSTSGPGRRLPSMGLITEPMLKDQVEWDKHDLNTGKEGTRGLLPNQTVSPRW